jgi:hypothetical protein
MAHGFSAKVLPYCNTKRQVEAPGEATLLCSHHCSHHVQPVLGKMHEDQVLPEMQQQVRMSDAHPKDSNNNKRRLQLNNDDVSQC